MKISNHPVIFTAVGERKKGKVSQARFDENIAIPHPSEYGLPHDRWRPYQLETVQWIEKSSGVMICEQPTGCHRAGQKILMWSGRTIKVEHIETGDLLMGPDSIPRRVLSLIQGDGQMYTIIPTKGDSFVVNEDHILTLQRTNVHKHGPKVRKDCLDGIIVDVPLKEYLGWSKWMKHIHKLLRVPVEFYRDDPQIDPYFLGVLLGDGCITKNHTVGITTMDQPIVDELYTQAEKMNLRVRIARGQNGKAASYWFSKEFHGNEENRIVKLLRGYNLYGCNSSTKFVPFEYKRGNTETRLQILAGLLDTDGYLGCNVYDYISKSKTLAHDVAFLCRSVGLAAYVTATQKTDQFGHGGIYYRVSVSGELDRIPCRIERKKASPRKQKKNVLRTGFKIEKLGIEPFYGFTLSGDGRYLLDDFTVTHNSGKSAVAASQSVSRRTISLVRTKYLQKQYGDVYNAHILMGKSNYPCAHPDHPTLFAGDCPEENMYQCPFSQRCEYLDAVKKARYLPFVSTNYAYWLSSRAIRENVELLVCDEAHLLSDIVLDWAGMTISAPVRRKWDLPTFPTITSSVDSLDIVQGWLAKSILILASTVEELSYSGRDDDLKEKKRASEQLMKLASTSKAIAACQQDWFVRSGPGICYYRGAPVPGLVVRPLTAKYHFPRMLVADYDMLLMSATIGNEDTFCGELGIANHWLRRVENQYVPAERPIFALDVPKLNYKSSYKDYERQADEIARAIKSCPATWSGFVHVTRKTEARKMADRLARRGLGGRVWIPPQQDRNGRWLGTGDQAILWNERRDRYPGSLCISWQFWEGMDGLDERINIIAKVPFPSLGDKYEKARMQYSKKMYSQRAAWTIMQAAGRTRRGRPQDYDLLGVQNGLVAIADGNWTRIKKYISPDFLKAITTFEERREGG